MTKKCIVAKDAPSAIGPYSQGVESNGMLFVSGQIPVDAKTGEVVSGGVAAQTERVLTNIRAIVEEAGLKMDDVVKTTVYLADISKFAEMNEVYAKFFTSPFPARATVEVSNLPKSVGVEIDAVAARNK